MNLIAGTSHEAPGLPARDGLWRLRPGEAPVWIDLELDRETVSAWRSRAARIHLGVDAWLALLLEQALVSSRLSEVGLSLAEIAAEALRSLTVTRLAPTPALRQWAAQLDGRRRRSGPADDELPTVVLPERLLAQVLPGALSEVLSTAVGNGDDEALVVERAATAVGQPADVWAYLTALRLRRGA